MNEFKKQSTEDFIKEILAFLSILQSGDFSKRLCRSAEQGGLNSIVDKLNELARHFQEKSETKYRTFFDSASDAIVICDIETGIIVDCNETAERLWKKNKNELIGHHQRTLHPVQAEDGRFRETFEQQMTPDGASIATTILTSEGKIRDVLIRAKTTVIDGKKVLLGIFMDITESNRMVMALKESEEKLTTLAQAAPNAWLLMSSDGSIIFTNPIIQKIFGYSPEELLGKNLHFTLAPERFREGYLRAHPFFAATGQGAAINKTLELVALHKDGHEFPIELSLAGVKLGGEWCGVGIVRDISEKKQAEREKEELHKKLFHRDKLAAIGTLAAGVAHEINNPLTIIKGNISLLRKDIRDERHLQLLEKQDKAVVRIANIVNALRSYARPDSEHVEIVDVNTIINETLALIEPVFANSDLTFELHLEEGKTGVSGNIGKLQQVIMNLLLNAKAAIEEIKREGKIVIQTANLQDCVEISISDNGCGIEHENLKKLFDPFYTSKPAGQGMGLGLSISQNIVTDFHGTIEVDSTVGVGTTFIVRFPSASSSSN